MIDRPYYVEKIFKFVNTPFVKVLTGVRRSGKTTILKMIIKKLQAEMNIPEKNILSFRYDSIEYEDFTAKEMFEQIKANLLTEERCYIFLDELQEISGWEKVVNTLLSDYNVDIYVTGSNSRMMSSEISTYLTGRYISFHIFTLSFTEFLTFKSKYTELKEPKEELVQYIKFGGFPATQLQKYELDEVYTIVKDIYNSTIFSDIVKRNNIRKVDQLERIVKYAFNNIGNTFSAKSISDYLKSEKRTMDNETVYSYLDKLTKAYILHRCPRYDIKGKEILKTQEKFYVADTSFIYSVFGFDSNTVASSLENLVCIELLRRDYSVAIGKTLDGEIDFIATKQNEKLYVQVTQEINSASTEKREYNRLLEIKDNYPKYVLRTDSFSEGNHKGIKTMHVADFLLSKDY